MNKSAKEQLVIPANVDHLGELREFVTRVGKKYGYSERVINAFKLSIDEAATNIIKHAYKEWSGDITIRAIKHKNSMSFILIDNGKYFDPRTFKDPDLNKYVDIGKKGGLGIFMMRRLLDKIDYKKTDAGNELWLTKSQEEKKLKKISVSSIPVGLKARYWLVSMAAFSIILILVYMFFFVNQGNIVLSRYIEKAREACSLVGSDLSKNLLQSDVINRDMVEDMRVNGTQDPTILNYSFTSVQNLLDTEYNSILYNAFVVDNIRNILATAEIDTLYNILDTFNIPDGHKVLRDNVLLYNLRSGAKVIDVNWPVKDDHGQVLCTIHFFINNELVTKETASVRFDYFNLALLVWVIGSAGLFLLIYLVMSPFKRLQDWVKAMGQPGAAEELDIDTSTEVGEIAKAFSDITLQLRDSQANLAEQERLQKEMQVAQEIQQTLLPSEFPKLEGYDLSSFYAAAKEVGGDYYDFVEVDQDTLGIVVADVSGKGVPGSLVMTMIRTALRTEARGIKDAAQVLTRVNDFVVNDMKKGMFVTLFYVIIDSKRRRINFASAGHNPMILYRQSQKKTYYLNPRGFPIGISLPDKDLFKNSLESDTIALAKGDVLVVYTDGVTEAMNNRRDLYGEERFLKVIQGKSLNTAEEFVIELKSEIMSFTEGFPQNDDITLVAIKEQTTAEMLELDRAKETFLAIQNGESVKRACKQHGISTYSYYHKYKAKFESEGPENITIDEPDADQEFEVKQLSIEEKTKIYDIIKCNPEFGAKRISEELNTEAYEFTHISPNKIYDELVNSRLNTKKLRENFMARSHRKKRVKPPGTPMMTIDGKIIIDKPNFVREPEPEPEPIAESSSKSETLDQDTSASRQQPPAAIKGPQDNTEQDVTPPEKETKAEPATTDATDLLSFEDITDYTMPDNWLTDMDTEPTSASAPADQDDEIMVDGTQEFDLDELDDQSTFDDFLDHEEADEAEEITDTEATEKAESGTESEFESEPEPDEMPQEIVDDLTTVDEQDSEQEIIHQEESKPKAEAEPTASETTPEKAVSVTDAEQNKTDAASESNDKDLPEIKVNMIDIEDDASKDDINFKDIYETKAPDPGSETQPETETSGHFEEAFEEQDDQEWTSEADEQNTDIVTTMVDDDLLMETLEHDFTAEDDLYSPAEMVEPPQQDETDEPPEFYEPEISHPEEKARIEEEPDLDDLGVEGKQKISDVEQEERELLDMLESKKSYIDEPGDDRHILHFDDSEIEDADVISETTGVQPFADFIETESARQDKDDRVDDKDLVDEEYDFSISLDDIWNIKEMKPEPAPSSRPVTEQEEPDKMSFEDLINLAGGNAEEKQETFREQEDRVEPAPNVQLEKDKLFRDKMLSKAIRLYEKENYSEAIQVLLELRESSYTDLKIHGYLGNAYFHSKQYSLAAQEYEKVLQINANNIQACENLGVVYANQGNLSKAIEQWERLLAISPQRNDIKKSIERAKKYLNKMI